jgi:hypothetical protein
MATSISIVVAIALSVVLPLLAVQESAAVGIDHVILGINDLERGMREFASRTGVTPRKGGEHPGRGTQNALVALGYGRYLEILAPAASRSPQSPADPRLEHAELTLVGWALHTRAIGSVVQQVRSAGFDVEGPSPGSRRAPDGSLLAWQSAIVQPSGLTPFFIEWSKDTPHPSTTAPSGCTLQTMQLTHPAPERLQSFFKTIEFPATVSRGEPRMRITLVCPSGRVEFES